jgi:hypothetical protein
VPTRRAPTQVAAGEHALQVSITDAFALRCHRGSESLAVPVNGICPVTNTTVLLHGVTEGPTGRARIMWKIGADRLIPSFAVDQVGERLAGEKASRFANQSSHRKCM